MSDMYEAGTGAVRSSDLKTERWDLLSGPALYQLRCSVPEIDPTRYSVEERVDQAADHMWAFLGHCTRSQAGRLTLLVRGWAWLASAMEAEEGVEYVRRSRYPLVTLRRTAGASFEGAVKYGEENWHNGFRTKDYCNHALRHMCRYTNGIIEDDELGHASWGFQGATHNQLYRPDMNDLLLGPDFTITEELRVYHKAHLSRKQVTA